MEIRKTEMGYYYGMMFYEKDYCRPNSLIKTVMTIQAIRLGKSVDFDKEDDKCTLCKKPIVLLVNFPIKHCYPDNWKWNVEDKASLVDVVGVEKRGLTFTNHFFDWGNIGIRGDKPLDKNTLHYWDIYIPIVYGKMMFGISTKDTTLYSAFEYLLGKDDQSWALSNKGLLWHNGESKRYTDEFDIMEAVVIGVLFDGNEGTVTYYKDGVCLGVAFSGLDKVEKNLFPIVSSSDNNSRMTVVTALRSYTNLQDRCRATILFNLQEKKDIDSLPLPTRLKDYVTEAYFF